MATITDIEGWQSCILRTTNVAQATALASSGLTDAQIQSQLLEQADTSTIPALLVRSLMLGNTQTEAQLDSNAAFALNQFNSYTAKGVLDPNLGPYEAMGLALSRDPGFLASVAGQSVPQVITEFYLQASNGINPSGAQIQHFVDQYNYFVSIYSAVTSDPDFAAHAQQEALGAVVGQIIGVFGEQEGSSLDLRADSFLLGCINGTSNFGGPLPTLHEFDLTIGVDAGAAFTTAEHGAVFSAQPGSNPPLGVTNTLNTGDNLQDSAGDGTLNYTAVASLINGPFPGGVTMNGIATANITNLAGTTAGFFGSITGLQNVTVTAGSNAGVQLGTAGFGLNTALQNITLQASHDFTAWLTNAALAGSAAVTVSLSDANTAAHAAIAVTLNTTGGTNGYNTINVVSDGGAANTLHLDSNVGAPNINVSGAQHLTIDGSALNLNPLVTFDASATSGGVDGTFFGAGGSATIIGGSGNDHFTFSFDAANINVQGNAGDDVFTFLSANGGSASFGAGDSADGGSGNDMLQIQADTGEILGGGTITNIETVQHITNGNANGSFSANMANLGSAPVLDLHGAYAGFDVTVNSLTDAQTILYTGSGLDDLFLHHVGVIGTDHLTMSGGGTHTIDTLHTDIGDGLALASLGGGLNVIDNAQFIESNIAITGNTNLSLGFVGAAYNFNGGIVDASTFTGNLTIGLGSGSQTLVSGSGNDLIDVRSGSAPDFINISSGGNDTIQFDAVITNANQNISVGAADFTHITGFNVGNDVISINVPDINIHETNNTGVFNPPAIFLESVGQNANLSGSFTDMIKFDAAIGGNLTAQQLFAQGIGGGDITVATPGLEVLFAGYNNDTQQMVLFTVNSGANNHITATDDVDVVATVGMSFTDFQTFGNNGSLHFV